MASLTVSAYLELCFKVLVSILSVLSGSNTHVEDSLCKDIVLKHQEQILLNRLETIEILYTEVSDQFKQNLRWQFHKN